MTDKVAFEPPPNRTAAILVLFDHDGVTPTRRDFRSVAEGVKAFERLEAYHAALRRQNRAAPNGRRGPLTPQEEQRHVIHVGGLMCMCKQ